MVEFLSGAVTCAYVMAAMHFLRFWKRAGDALFLIFALAFGLLAANQGVLFVIGSVDEIGNYAYLLRVFAFTLILGGIVYKNLPNRGARRSR